MFWRFWERCLRDRGYMVGMLLRDPFHEIAERLFILKLASSHGGNIIDAVGPVVEAAAAHLRNIDLRGFRRSKRPCLGADRTQGDPLQSSHLPADRTNAFDPPATPTTAIALESLADMDAVGLRHDPESFFELVSAVLEVSENLSTETVPTSSTVVQWADLLRERPAMRQLSRWISSSTRARSKSSNASVASDAASSA